MGNKLATECLMHAAHSRQMWLDMKHKGYGTCWDHYRGWLLEARNLRLGGEFGGYGIRGVAYELNQRNHRR